MKDKDGTRAGMVLVLVLHADKKLQLSTEKYHVTLLKFYHQKHDRCPNTKP